MAKENQTRYAILGMLSHEPLSGYDIKKRIEISLSCFWSAGFGQIYPSLGKLEEEKLVTKRIETSENRPSRKIYTITEEGREELKTWLSTPVRQENVRYEILLKLFFGSQIPVESNIQNIAEFRSRNSANLETLKQFEQQLRGALTENKDHIYYLLTVLFGQHVYNAYLTWADQAINMLEELKSDST